MVAGGQNGRDRGCDVSLGILGKKIYTVTVAMQGWVGVGRLLVYKWLVSCGPFHA